MTPEEAKDMHALAIGAAPVASAGDALSDTQIDSLIVGLKHPDTTREGARLHLRAALASQSTPVAPAVEQAYGIDLSTYGPIWGAICEWEAAPRGPIAGKAADAIDEAIIRAFDVVAAQSTPHVPAGEPTNAEAERDQAQQVCAEAYQVVGSMLSDLGQFETERAGKILDNLSQHRMVHHDVLPWPSFEPLATPRAPEPAAPVVAWRDPTNMSPGQGCTYDEATHKKWPHIFKQPLYAAPTAAQGLSDAEIKAVITDAVGFEWAGLWPVQSMNSSDLMNIARSLLSANRADFGPICPNSGKPCALAHTGQAVDKDSLTGR